MTADQQTKARRLPWETGRRWRTVIGDSLFFGQSGDQLSARGSPLTKRLTQLIIPRIEAIEGAADIGLVDRQRLGPSGSERQSGDSGLACEYARQGRADTKCIGRAARPGHCRQQPVHPPAASSVLPWRTVLEIKLCIEMRSCWVGRTRGMNECEPVILPERHQTGECRVQPKMRVECQCSVRLARRRDRDRSPLLVIVLVGKWNNDIESIDSAAKQDDDQTLLAAISSHGPRTWARDNEPGRHPFEEIPPACDHHLPAHKIGLPRIRAGRNVCGDSLTTSRVESVIIAPKIASKCAALTGFFVVVKPRLLRASAVAKLIRRVVASGLNQASSVFLYPSGVRHP